MSNCRLADAQERGLTVRNPVHELRGKRRKAEAQDRRGSKLKIGVDIPTPDEIKSIIRAAKGRWRPFLLWGCVMTRFLRAFGLAVAMVGGALLASGLEEAQAAW